MFGEKEIADAFDVSPRTLRRWLKRSEITLPLIREQIILPREHLYFLWLRLCRDRRHRYHAIAMANAGHAMWKYLNRVRMEND